MTKYQLSALIGFHRMGNSDAVIADILNIPLAAVFSAIKLYNVIEN